MDIVAQHAAGNRSIVGAMLESNLVAGMQSIPEAGGSLVYGQSITDGCIDWDSTEKIILDVAESWG
jgi:3-deoxy-7-phosphoheptulonate synthase